MYLVKTDSSGQNQWQKTFGGPKRDVGMSLQQTEDNGYIICGYTSSYGSGDWDVYLIKTDSSGNLKWEKTFGGSERDAGYSILQTADGGYVLCGYTKSFGSGDRDVYLLKIDPSGNKQWQETYGGTDFDVGLSVQQTPDGEYVICGETKSYGSGNKDVYLIKTNSNASKK